MTMQQLADLACRQSMMGNGQSEAVIRLPDGTTIPLTADMIETERKP